MANKPKILELEREFTELVKNKAAITEQLEIMNNALLIADKALSAAQDLSEKLGIPFSVRPDSNWFDLRARSYVPTSFDKKFVALSKNIIEDNAYYVTSLDKILEDYINDINLYGWYYSNIC